MVVKKVRTMRTILSILLVLTLIINILISNKALTKSTVASQSETINTYPEVISVKVGTNNVMPDADETTYTNVKINGINKDAVNTIFGDPDFSLSGFFGDAYYTKTGVCVTFYYDPNQFISSISFIFSGNKDFLVWNPSTAKTSNESTTESGTEPAKSHSETISGNSGTATTVSSENDSESPATTYIDNLNKKSVHTIFGEPDKSLSGFDGDVYITKEGVTMYVYYDTDQSISCIKILNDSETGPVATQTSEQTE
jgi:hypothetical protein